MKNARRFLAVLLSAVLAFSVGTQAFAADGAVGKPYSPVVGVIDKVLGAAHDGIFAAVQGLMQVVYRQFRFPTYDEFMQAEAHPYFPQTELRRTLDKYGIRLMSWYPLGHGDKSLIQEPVFGALGEKYGKSPAQIILRWHTQMGFAVIPGSKNVDHIRDNLDILDFALTPDEMAQIAALDKNMRYYHRTDEQLLQFAAWRPGFENA